MKKTDDETYDRVQKLLTLARKGIEPISIQTASEIENVQQRLAQKCGFTLKED